MKSLWPIAAVLAVLVLASCGGHRSAGLPIQQAAGNPSSQQTLAELDALSCPQGVNAEVWAELKGALEVALGKAAATPPTGTANRVDDLAITDNGDGTYILSWRYRNLGDYDQNGTVGISDITPIALHFGETYDPVTEPNSIQAVIDGSGNGKVDIADITPIAQNFGIEVADYPIEGAAALEGPFSEVGTVSVDSATGAETDRAVFEHAFAPGEYEYFRVTARDAAGTPGEASNTVGLALQILSVTPTEVKEGTVVTFSAEVLGAGPLIYEWDFGGGAQHETYTGPSPRVVLTRDTGGFPASLTVTGPMGDATFPFTLSKLAREWKLETVFKNENEVYSLGAASLREFQGKYYCVVELDSHSMGASSSRLLITGYPGNWTIAAPVDVDCYGPLELTSQGEPAILRYSGPPYNLTLRLAEWIGDSWKSDTIMEQLYSKGGSLAFAVDDVPFVAYAYEHWVDVQDEELPVRTIDLRYARRTDGEWRFGTVDDAGGAGGYISHGSSSGCEIQIEVDSACNPSVAYDVKVEESPGRYNWELRLATWNSQTEEWDRCVVLERKGFLRFDFQFSPASLPSFVYTKRGAVANTTEIDYASFNGDVWTEDFVEQVEQALFPEQGLSLTYNPVGNPVTAFLGGNSSVLIAWHENGMWVTEQVVGNARLVVDLLIDEFGTPYLLYLSDDEKEVILARYE